MLPTKLTDTSDVSFAGRVAAQPAILRHLLAHARNADASVLEVPGRREAAVDSDRFDADPAEFKLVGRDLRLADGLFVDAVFRDSSARPWWVFTDDAGGSELLGRVLRAWLALSRLRPVFEQWGAPGAIADPTVVLVCRRFDDGVRAAARELPIPDLWSIEWPEVLDQPSLWASLGVGTKQSEAPAPEPNGLPDSAPALVRRSNGPQASGLKASGPKSNGPGSNRASTNSPSSSGSRSGGARSNGGANSKGGSDGTGRSPRQGRGRHRAGSALVDEAKRKLLRIGDEVCEEVDGELVRFLVHGRVLADLADSLSGLSLYVGDRPERRRKVSNPRELDLALDDVFRRFCVLVASPVVD